MTSRNYTFTYINEFEEEYTIAFKVNEYHNLMELLFDKCMEDIGDCKSRAWCGTCHIQVLEGQLPGVMDADEKDTLSKAVDVTKNSRLACQIPVNAELDNLVFRIMPRV